jgi:hypothetical protein
MKQKRRKFNTVLHCSKAAFVKQKTAKIGLSDAFSHVIVRARYFEISCSIFFLIRSVQFQQALTLVAWRSPTGATLTPALTLRGKREPAIHSIY